MHDQSMTNERMGRAQHEMKVSARIWCGLNSVDENECVKLDVKQHIRELIPHMHEPGTLRSTWWFLLWLRAKRRITVVRVVATMMMLFGQLNKRQEWKDELVDEG
jgi:hypothetical protein